MGFELFIIFVALILTIMLMKSDSLKGESRAFKFLLILILLISVAIRIYKLESAMGLNSDEAMGGYNAWCLANYGVSSHLNSWPVYLIAWGSGMNILYPLLTVPIVKCFGLSVVSYRFPLVLLSIISYYVLTYVLLKTQKNKKLSLFFIMILTLSPWTILQSRWAVESNLFPVLMTFSLCCYLMCEYYDFKGIKGYTSFVLFNIIMAFSAYAYSCDWIYLAIFMLILYGWLLIKRRVNFKHIIIALIICLAILWPLLLFIYVNYLGGHQIKIGKITITQMTSNRSSDAWVIVKDHPLVQIIINIFRFIYYIVLKNMFYSEKEIHFLACYPTMMIIAVIGLIYIVWNKKRKHSTLEQYLLISTIASIPLILITWNNFVRDNVLILPVFYFCTIGVFLIFKTKKLKKLFIAIFTIFLIGFSYEYFIGQHNSLAINPSQGVAGNQTSIELPKALEKANSMLKNKNSKIYINQKYINTLYTAIRFYDPINPYKFAMETDNYKDIVNDNTLKNGKDYHFSKYYITVKINKKMLDDKNAVYIVRNDVSQKPYKNNGLKAYKYGPYTVYVH